MQFTTRVQAVNPYSFAKVLQKEKTGLSHYQSFGAESP